MFIIFGSLDRAITRIVATCDYGLDQIERNAKRWRTLGSIQHLYLQSDSSAVITEGDGSAVYFAKVGGTWVSPAAEFSTLASSTLSLTSGWARTYSDGTRAVFDNRGWMVQLRDRFDNITYVQYDGTGRVAQIADPANLALNFTYGTFGLASIQDPGLRTTTVTVDASRKLTAITDPDNLSTTFIHDATLQLWKVINRRGDTTEFNYDTSSRKFTFFKKPPVVIPARS